MDAFSEPPIPKDPAHFIGTLYFSEIEDETGSMPAALEHIGKVGHMPLTTTIDTQRGVIVLRGFFNPDSHPIRHVPFAAGHKGGMTFMLMCKNQNRVVHHQEVWKRSFTKKQMETLEAEVAKSPVLRMVGHCPNLAHGQGTNYATFTMGESRGNYFIQEVQIELDYKTYEAWIWSMSH